MSNSGLFQGIERLSSYFESKKKSKNGVPTTVRESDEETDNEKMKLIDSNMILCIKTCRLFFSVPYTYSVEYKLEIITSKWYNLAYRANVVIIATAVILKFYSIIRDIENESFDMGNRVDPYRILHFLVCAMCSVMHVNYALKLEEIRETWQKLVTFGRTRIQKEKLDRLDKICDLLMKFFYVNIGSAEVGMSILFVLDCRFHTLATILPTCSADGHTHRHPLLMLPLLLMQFFWACSYGATISLSANFILVAVQFLNTVLDDLTNASIGNGQLTQEWASNYRCSRILVDAYNRCFGKFVFPSFFLLLVLSFVFSNYIILSTGSDLVSQIYCVTISGGLAVFTVLVIKDATYFPANSRAAILSRSRAFKRRMRSLSHATLNSFPTMKIFVHNFFYLDEDLMPMLLNTIIEYTIDVILSY